MTFSKAYVVGVVLGLLLIPAVVGAESICDVQFNNSNPGTGDDCYPSPEEGSTVTIIGIVTGLTTNTAFDNFWIQENSQFCSGLWSGIYVFDNSMHPSRGDSITLTGSISEYYGMTEIAPSSHQIHASGRPLPEPVPVSSADLAGGCSATGEAYEGVLVRIDNVVVTQDLNGYGEWYVTDDGGATQCQIDDRGFHYDPTVGDTLAYVIGLVSYSFNEYEINPRDIKDIGTEIVSPPCAPISEIQFGTDRGTGDDCYPSPSVSVSVTLCGVVTGVTTNTAFDNFWLQDAESRWSGIYIFDNTIHPDRGDSLKLTGTISEYYGLTELNVSSWEQRATGIPEPEPLLITCADLAGGCSDTTRESYEGVLVQINEVEVTQEPDQFGQWFVTDDGGITQCEIDDACFHYDAVVGETFHSIVGVVQYSFEEYEINPRDASDLTSIEPWNGSPRLPTGYALSQNYPNPFNPLTEIEFSLPRSGWVELEIYNVAGQKVATLVDGRQGAGTHRVRWNADAPSGVYLCRLNVGEYMATRKMVLLR